jgi:mannose-6-phosphate isomerase-like protein (cupin superfamily)
MRVERANATSDKGWYIGPWNSSLQVSVGYANKGIDEPHVHAQITEIYLVARGTAQIRVERETVTLAPGDIIAIEAGEAHTFLNSSPDYLHFVVHTPGLSGTSARGEKSVVPRSRLEL